MLFLWFLSKERPRLQTDRPRWSARPVSAVSCLVATMSVAAMSVALCIGGVAAAQAEDDSLAGLPVTVENTFASDELTDGDEIVFGSAGPTKIGTDVEFADCCEGFYDIDVASDRITMTWVGNEDFARVIEPGTFDRYRFTVVGATFADAVADPDQALVPDVTFFSNSISVKISEGDKVGPGQDAVILIEPIVTAESRAAGTAASGTSADDATSTTSTTSTTGTTGDERIETLPNTGLATEVLAAVGFFVLALGLISYGVGNRARRLEIT